MHRGRDLKLELLQPAWHMLGLCEHYLMFKDWTGLLWPSCCQSSIQSLFMLAWSNLLVGLKPQLLFNSAAASWKPSTIELTKGWQCPWILLIWRIYPSQFQRWADHEHISPQMQLGWATPRNQHTQHSRIVFFLLWLCGSQGQEDQGIQWWAKHLMNLITWWVVESKSQQSCGTWTK